MTDTPDDPTAAYERARAEMAAAEANEATPLFPGDNCPLVPIGHNAGVYYFCSQAGQLRDVKARDMQQRLVLSDICGGSSWLQQHWPRFDPKGELVGINLAAAAEWLMAACRARGVVDRMPEFRRAGVWRATKGRLAVHVGNEVRLGDAEWQPAAVRDDDGTLYVACQAQRGPAPPCGPEVAREAERHLQHWFWDRPQAAPVVLLGWTACAMLGQAPQWRPGVFLASDDQGAGKSSLMRFLRRLQCMSEHASDTSIPSMFWLLDRSPRPAFVDEQEAGGASQALIKAYRSIADSDGAARIRMNEGAARTSVVTSCIMCAAIEPPVMETQDSARWSVVLLRQPRDGGDRKAEMDAATEWASTVAPALWGRALDRWPAFAAALRIARALVIDRGCAPRDADQYGHLAAGYWLLAEDGEASQEALAPIVRRLSPYFRTVAETADDGRARRCLAAFLSAQVVTEGNRRRTVSELLSAGVEDHPEAFEARREARIELARVGISLEPKAEPTATHIAIAKRHAGSSGLFSRSPWADGWWQALQGLEGVAPSPRNVRIGGRMGVSGPALLLPLGVLADPDEDGHDDPV